MRAAVLGELMGGGAPAPAPQQQLPAAGPRPRSRAAGLLSEAASASWEKENRTGSSRRDQQQPQAPGGVLGVRGVATAAAASADGGGAFALSRGAELLRAASTPPSAGSHAEQLSAGVRRQGSVAPGAAASKTPPASPPRVALRQVGGQATTPPRSSPKTVAVAPGKAYYAVEADGIGR